MGPRTMKTTLSARLRSLRTSSSGNEVRPLSSNLIAGREERRAEWGPAYVDHWLVFARENGEPIHPETVTKRFGKLAAAAGLRPVRLHDLRHGQASLMLAAGVPLAVVSKRLGHSSVSITSDTYSHLLEGVGREAAERAAALVPRNRREHIVSSQGVVSESAGARPAESGGSPNESAGQKRVSPVSESAPPGTRTPNPRIKRPKFTRSQDDYLQLCVSLEAAGWHRGHGWTVVAGQIGGQQVHCGPRMAYPLSPPPAELPAGERLAHRQHDEGSGL